MRNDEFVVDLQDLCDENTMVVSFATTENPPVRGENPYFMIANKLLPIEYLDLNMQMSNTLNILKREFEGDKHLNDYIRETTGVRAPGTRSVLDKEDTLFNEGYFLLGQIDRSTVREEKSLANALDGMDDKVEEGRDKEINKDRDDR